MTEHNPYATPSAEVRDIRRREGFRKASRGKRLGATILDMVIFWAVLFIGSVIAFLLGGDIDFSPDAESFGSPIMLGLMGLGTIALVIAQCVLISRNGWTIGKKMLSIRVVRTDGEPCSLGRYLGLRVIANYLLSIIPLYGLVDSLFIFGEQSRCVHDYVADTIVIDS